MSISTSESRRDIEAVKQSVDIVSLAAEYGLDPKPNYKGATARCPHCDSDSRSAGHLYLVSETNSFYCWKSHTGGDAISFIAYVERCGKSDAARTLLRRFRGQVPLNNARPRTPIPLPCLSSLLNILPGIWGAFSNSEADLRYLLIGRNLDMNTLKRFDIRAMPNPRASFENLKKQFPEYRSQLFTWLCGKKAGGRPLVAFPHYKNGALVYISIRYISGEPKTLNIPGLRKKYFNLDAIPKHTQILVFEGVINMLSYYQLTGMDNAIATLGTVGGKEFSALRNAYPTKEFILAYDMDEAGLNAMKKLEARFFDLEGWYLDKFPEAEKLPSQPDGKTYDLNDILVTKGDLFMDKSAMLSYYHGLTSREAGSIAMAEIRQEATAANHSR